MSYPVIRELPPEQRPRERMIKEGPGSLSDIDLLAIMLRTGTAKASAMELAAEIIGRFKDLRALAQATVEELSAIKGIGPVKAVQVKAALELGRRLAALPTEERTVIRCPEDVAALLMEDLRDLDREHFLALLLNTKNRVLSKETISIGTLNSSMVHPRELFKIAIRRSAAAIILAHNHPSGDPTPSREDIMLTKRLIEVGQIIGIDVLDHIIIGDNRFTSLKSKGLI
ncbi:DNA repair protein RadC [Desulfotomaculum nigrificans CO-1-SRB]|uniref:DNA repair protein RadC n=1 Tax=Desulfotomaculum nigrificans (strain DSM 14880 / VKM B-2319 / CO-1-SRB) TaxID=868595 RepID=F6B8L9_DESCC|nr:DNA repair protein RadC [Desulfotomaculum nigrificans]AEF93591.1 DNA repair protein RadC [Desulfotomaculum nigrificans CO-1-SRB]